MPGAIPSLWEASNALLGPSVLTAKLLNVGVGTVSLLLIYNLGKTLSGEAAGRLAAILFALWPSQLFLTSVLASEHLGLLAALAAQCILVAAINTPNPRWTSLVASGVLMAVSSIVRSALLVLFIAAALTVVLVLSARSGVQFALHPRQPEC